VDRVVGRQAGAVHEVDGPVDVVVSTHRHGLPLHRHAAPSLARAGPTVSFNSFMTPHTWW
jgi:hypothetical protein